MNNVGITVYGCEQDESIMFNKLSPRLGVVPAITSKPVSVCGAMDFGNRCISVDHKTKISESSLLPLRKAGVRYISTRSVGIDHIDVEAARKMGIAVGNVEYSPDSVADYTIMLMLMAIRGAKPVVTGAAKFDFRLNAVRGKELRDTIPAWHK
jgi:D-specific alpha-keto acid dehydrogenase